jgi:hypothetical protein
MLRAGAMVILAMIGGCRLDSEAAAPPVADVAPSAVPAAAATATSDATQPPASTTQAAAECASAAIAALDKKDMRRIAELAHPVAGIRFTPFGFVRPAEDVVLRSAELKEAMSDAKVRNWGILGESDDPIRMTFAQFFARFVYDAPFARLGPAPAGTMATFETASHSVPELRKTLEAAYPGAEVFEYRKPSSKSDLPDWRVLRLVCQQHEAKHYLVGIVHSEWTP